MLRPRTVSPGACPVDQEGVGPKTLTRTTGPTNIGRKWDDDRRYLRGVTQNANGLTSLVSRLQRVLG